VTAVTAGTLAAACAACGEPAGPDANPAASPTAGRATASAQSAEVTRIAVTVADGKARTASGRVKVRRGANVEITVTSDAADEFHLHGYDRTLALRPGRAGTLRLVADTPGVFEAELHHSGARAFELQVG
jgi:FtsP/CotA-like multicopper oxidase with cupredoxin domain